MKKQRRQGRFIVTRVIRDRNVPKRYQRSGWIVFDTGDPIAFHPFFFDKGEAAAWADRVNAREASA